MWGGNDPSVKEIGGYFRFWRHNDKVYIIALPKTTEGYLYDPVSEVTFDKTTKQYLWNFGDHLFSEVTLFKGDHLIGKSYDVGSRGVHSWAAFMLPPLRNFPQLQPL